jgi:hypothetical protein
MVQRNEVEVQSVVPNKNVGRLIHGLSISVDSTSIKDWLQNEVAIVCKDQRIEEVYEVVVYINGQKFTMSFEDFYEAIETFGFKR